MKRAITYAIIMVAIITLALVTLDMYQRQSGPFAKPEQVEETTKKDTSSTKAQAEVTTTPKAKLTSHSKYEVTADIKGKRTTKGQIIAVLYDDMTAFNQNRHDLAVATIMTPAKGFNGQLRFDNLKAGQYALVLFHDENGNQQFDQTVAHIEGYAYSNNVGKSSMPNFHQAAFEVKADKQLTIHLIYH